MAKSKMTHFICRELLYDYAIGNLEEKRSKEVEDFIAKHEDLQQELDSIQSAINYTRNLKRITVSQPYHQKLLDQFHKESSTYYIKKASITTVKWSGAVAAIVLLYIYFPSERIIQYFERDPNKIVIAEVETTDELNDLPVTMHGDMGEELDSLLAANSEEPTTLKDTFDQEDSNSVEMSAEEEKRLEAKLKKQEEDLKKADEEESSAPPERVVKNEEPEPSEYKGMLHRAFLRVDDKEIVAKAILQKLKELGATKGGSVRLGWVKPNDNRYFHFIITESNFEIFKTYVNTIKDIQINSYPHPRVMEEGYVRMILEVENI